MNFSTFLQAASKECGAKIPPKIARYAIDHGGVSQPVRGADGWYQYSEKNVAELVQYVKSRSRRMRNALSVAS